VILHSIIIIIIMLHLEGASASNAVQQLWCGLLQPMHQTEKVQGTVRLHGTPECAADHH
jgi:hypothetical protein